MAHFACHGIANTRDPPLSQLKLYDWKTAPLDVRILSQHPYTGLQFVYLSACESGVTKAPRFEEESVHISAAFQAAGVPYAVATLWSIEDRSTVDIATSFYSRLAEGSEIDFSRSAEALHYAVMQARNRGIDPLLWASFVHFGA
ncbi:hypothetical protein NLJ89_g8140 [Agrocybe chaxingu]|uniref:CHAT domain-containing protein n=1 Tax=Agrocybe chaxingu TaxID=84603 RepID=A0A9W8MR26_9AGAR|nr:hypothetical protein NLJ89_g8140 [Agrocybe chaxingu]